MRSLIKPIKFTNFFTFFCVIGCLLQLNQVVVNHLNYDFSTRITIGITRKLDFPNLVLCFEIGLFIDYNKLVLYQSKFASSIGVKNISEWYHLLDKNFDIISDKLGNLRYDQVTDILYSMEDLFNRVTIEHEFETFVTRCRFPFYYSLNHVCVLSLCNHGINTFPDDARKARYSSRLLIYLNQTIISRIPQSFVTLTEGNEIPRHVEWINLAFSKESKLIQINFATWKTISLPFPYKTGCINYSRIGFKSRVHARFECLNSRSIRQLGYPFHSTFVQPHIDMVSGFEKYKQNKNNDSYVEIIREIVQKCYSKYQSVDCTKNRFQITTQPATFTSVNRTIIQLNQSKGPNFLITLEPSSSITELCIAISTIIASWFGLSFTHRAGKIVKSTRLLMKRNFFDPRSKNLTTSSLKKKSLKNNGIKFVWNDHTKQPTILAYRRPSTMLKIPALIYFEPNNLQSSNSYNS